MQTTDKSNFLRAEAELALDEARKVKAEKTKDLGQPIKLAGIALDIHIKDQFAWIAENTQVVRKVDLESGKTVQLFRGHTAPVTCLAFYEKIAGSSKRKFVISGSWDKVCSFLPLKTKELVSSTPAHADFLKVLLVIPALHLLVSSSSDKIVQFWDLSSLEAGKPLASAGSISAHTRPVEAITAKTEGDVAVLYTADTMGIIKVWELVKEDSKPTRWRAVQKDELYYHRTKINEILYGHGQIWTGV
ncbi:hypothetical protein PHLGIDRAFT_505241 [Phlebiopsis gigantea 11061_1 CR5-6]|uniref:Uncharacterized protein n=1 Tax=Phlebiopsis gigantea (strain 11061_1 CR5-6) TaxID=745531 RepID=A0A0C3SAI4_PHLG1|nr:hypothetical protein PHLGIDRAFT_505241 [Phlebiopsis gigantea 11061_1 CR5-6]